VSDAGWVSASGSRENRILPVRASTAIAENAGLAQAASANGSVKAANKRSARNARRRVAITAAGGRRPRIHSIIYPTPQADFGPIPLSCAHQLAKSPSRNRGGGGTPHR